jgi:hypothetical protein
VTKLMGLIRRIFRYMTRGLANFVRMLRDDIRDADLDAGGFYLCESCGYAHIKGSGCRHTQSPGE